MYLFAYFKWMKKKRQCSSLFPETLVLVGVALSAESLHS